MTDNENRPFAIVVGGSAGVGRAVVDELLHRGYDVGIVARGKTRLSGLQRIAGVDTESADAGDAKDLSRAINALVNRNGVPDVWVNCAMATAFSAFAEVGSEEFDKIVRTTFLGQVNGTRLALEMMNHGHIVHVGSGLSYRPVPYQAAYCAAKHAINGFVGAVRSEVIREGRDLNLSLVQLPAINTPQFDWARNRLSQKPQPAPPIFTPQVAARAVMKAIDTHAREIIVGRSVLQLMLGDMVLPNYLDNRLASSGVKMQKSDRPADPDKEDNLFGPTDYPARAEGSYSDRAQNRAIIVDGDAARKAFFFGGMAIAVLAGAALYKTFSTPPSTPRLSDREDYR